jgi:hypothetical protein
MRPAHSFGGWLRDFPAGGFFWLGVFWPLFASPVMQRVETTQYEACTQLWLVDERLPSRG